MSYAKGNIASGDSIEFKSGRTLKADIAVAVVCTSAKFSEALLHILSMGNFTITTEVVKEMDQLPTCWTAPIDSVLLLDYALVRHASKQKTTTLFGQQRIRPRVLVAGNNETQVLEKCSLLQAGASGYVALPRDIHFLPRAIRVVADNDMWFERSVLSQAICSGYRNKHWDVDTVQTDNCQSIQPQSTLSPRETMVAQCATQGLRNREIALLLGIAENTVKLHLTRIYRKLGILNRVQLILHSRSAQLKP